MADASGRNGFPAPARSTAMPMARDEKKRADEFNEIFFHRVNQFLNM